MADRREQFVTTYLPYAQQASAITGIDPGVILAQAAHETAWGRSAPGNNFFGIKGRGQSFATHEYEGGKRVNQTASFRRYDSPLGSFLDWAKLMQTPRYAGVLAAETPEEQIKALKAAGYATDPLYVSKLKSVRNQVTRIAGDVPMAPAGPDVSAIMDVASLNEAPGVVPDALTAAQGFAPDLSAMAFAAPPPPPAQAAISNMLAAAPPTLPPQWADVASGFPIDEALTGRTAQDVLMGGPRSDPRRISPASAPIAPDMGSMLSPADVLEAGPRLRPPVEVDMPLPQARPDLPAAFRPGPGGALGVDLGTMPAGMPLPPDRPGGAPDAGLVPMPPPRASGLPLPPPRPDISDPSLSFNRQSGRGPDMRDGLPPFVSPVMGRPEFPGGLPAASSMGDMSAAMGNAPPVPSLFPPTPKVTDSFKQSFDLANDMNTSRENTEWWTGNLQPQASPPQIPGSGTQAFGPLPPAAYFDNANQDPMPSRVGDLSAAMGGPPAPYMPDFNFAPTPSPFGPQAGAMTGEGAPSAPNWQSPPGVSGMTYAPPMPPSPPAPPVISQAMRDQFDVAFSPGGPGQVMDLQSAFNNRNAPSTLTAQDGINSVFGAPPAAAQPPNLAIPFSEVPGVDLGRFAGAAPAAAATVASPLSPPVLGDRTNLPARFDDAFAGGSTVRPPTPVPGVTPGVNLGTMPQPGSPANISPPSPVFAPPPPSPPRQTNTGAEQDKQGFARSILGAIFGGGGGGAFGGGGILGGASFTPMGNTFSSPFNMQPNGQMGQTTAQHVNSGNMQGTMWNRSDGGSVGYVTDPFTGAMIYSASPSTF